MLRYGEVWEYGVCVGIGSIVGMGVLDSRAVDED